MRNIYHIQLNLVKSTIQSKNNYSNDQFYYKITTLNGSEIVTPITNTRNVSYITQIKLLDFIQRIQVWDYENIKIVAKLSLKGMNKQFQASHKLQPNNLKIFIKLQSQEPFIIDNKTTDAKMKVKNSYSTQQSNSTMQKQQKSFKENKIKKVKL